VSNVISDVLGCPRNPYGKTTKDIEQSRTLLEWQLGVG